jgi:hypothetical protein
MDVLRELVREKVGVQGCETLLRDYSLMNHEYWAMQWPMGNSLVCSGTSPVPPGPPPAASLSTVAPGLRSPALHAH